MNGIKKIAAMCLLAACVMSGLSAQDTDRKNDEDSVYIPVYVSFLPGNPLGVKVSSSLAAGLVVSELYSLDGFQFSPVMSIVESSVDGFQFAGVGALGGNELNGAQFSGVFGVTDGAVNGGQAAGVFNVSGLGLNGAQAAGVFNVSEGDTRWVQAAGVFNVAGGTMSGIQAAGVFNVAEDDVSGIQVAGVFNTAGDVDGVQVAGVLNVARKVRGIQIGLVNISDEMYGLPIGLINIVKHGIFDFSVWQDETGFVYTGLQKGTSNLYVLAYGGERKEDWFENRDTLTAALGVGTRIRLGSLYIDIDGAAKHMISGSSTGELLKNAFNFRHGEVFPSFRLMGGINLFGRVGVFGGMTLDCYVPGHSGYNPAFHTAVEPVSSSIGETEFTLYPKWFAGVKF